MEGLSFDFAGRRVLVTGGTSGIGHGVASAFADAGAEVIITGRRAEASEYDRDLTRFDYRQVEMTDGASLDALAGGIDRLDVLVNNAGSNLVAKDEWNPDTFAEALQLLLVSSFRLSVALKPVLVKSGIEGGGSIINCASMSAFRAVPLVPGYGAAKAGIVQATLNMGVSWARENIRVNAVAPGLIETGMTSVMKMEGMEAVEAAELARVPMGRWGVPEDIAPSVLFLASPGARFIIGQTLCVDGGFSVM
ncbi:MAG: SDR family oxidoreductase [Myxococcota bacterium]|jgi:NAD(P)-dependent dehydrogenase (short-subunit alcohol dehydrogenase family)|nr:SDR family oxidoreductase [Myxococcota bacterium]